MESTRSQYKRPEMLIIESRDPSGGFFQALLMVGYPPLQKSGILVGLSKDLGPFLIDFGGFQKVLVDFSKIWLGFSKVWLVFQRFGVFIQRIGWFLPTFT